MEQSYPLRALIICEKPDFIQTLSASLSLIPSLSLESETSVQSAFGDLSSGKYDIAIIHETIIIEELTPLLRRLDFIPILIFGTKDLKSFSEKQNLVNAVDYINLNAINMDKLQSELSHDLRIWQYFKEKASNISLRYQNIVEALPDIVYELEPNGHFTFLNKSISLLGYEPTELLGQHFSVLLFNEDIPHVSRKYVLPLYRDTKTGVRNAPKLFDERRGINRKTENLELRLKHKNGNTLKGPLIGSLISYGEIASAGTYRTKEKDKQEFIGTVGIIRDITIRRKSEDMLRKMYQAVDQSPNAVAILNQDLVIEYVNASFFTLTGTSPDQALGQKIDEFLGDTSDRSFFIDLYNSIKSGIEWQSELRCPRLGASPYWSSVLFTAVRTPFGSITHYLCLMEDITRKHLMDELLKEARDNAKEASREKSQLITSFSNQIDGPLNRILELADQLLIDSADEKTKHKVLRIQESAQSMIAMFHNISDLSKLQTDSTEIVQSEFSIIELIKEASESYSLSASRKALVLDLTLDDGGFPIIITDREKIMSIINILLTNAIENTEEGQIDLNISIKAKDEAPTLFVLVKDTGVGISGTDQQKLFKRPLSLGNSNTSGHRQGFGLVIAKELTQALGGDLWVESVPGQGSSFTFFIPILTPKSPPIEETYLGSNYSSLAILIIEDNPINGAFLCKHLRNSGCIVTTVNDSDQTLASLNSGFFDLVLINLQMPDMNGIIITKAIRAYNGSAFDPNIPIISFSSKAPIDYGEDYTLVGFSAHISKPIEKNTLFKAIDDVIAKRESFDLEVLNRRYKTSIDELRRILSTAYQIHDKNVKAFNEAYRSEKIESVDASLRSFVTEFSEIGAYRGIRLIKRYQKALNTNNTKETTKFAEELLNECGLIKKQIYKALKQI